MDAVAEYIIRILADGAVIPVVLVGAFALLFFIPNNIKYQAYCRILLAGLTAYLLAKLFGSIYQPALERPFELMGVEAGASFLNNPGFPSDHVLFCSAITLAVWFEVRSKKLFYTLLGLTIAVGIGRVLALVHSPIDVFGGAAIALISAGWYALRPANNLDAVLKLRRQWSKPRNPGKIS